MSRIPKPSPAMVVATISLIVAIGGTAFALPGKFTVGRDDLKDASVGARALGRAKLDYGLNMKSLDPIEGDGDFVESEGSVRCPSTAPFAMDPTVSGLGPRAFETRRVALANRWNGPGGYRFFISSDEGPDAVYGLSVNCLPTR